MKIVMMTNTYKPIVGGLEKSVETFSQEYRNRGHQVLIVAPDFKKAPPEPGVFRLPALKDFNKTGFSIQLPIPSKLTNVLAAFKPDIIHSHHPFLVGDTALRAAATFKIPIVFTHHTLYAENSHYLPAGDTEAMKKFVTRLAKGYANLCDQVIAPSQSVADMLIKKGVTTPVAVLPTGIYLEQFQNGDGKTFRKFFDIPQNVFLVGIIGRLAEEKNVPFLSKAVAAFIKKSKDAYFLVVGDGPELERIKQLFQKNKISDRLICAGTLRGKQLVSAYAALDVFAFASHSETQGLVLVEAMASGKPVVAVNASGVRDVIIDYKNGRIIPTDNVAKFADALNWVFSQSPQAREGLSKNARKTAQEFSMASSVERVLDMYAALIKRSKESPKSPENALVRTIRVIKTQAQLVTNMSKATYRAVQP